MKKYNKVRQRNQGFSSLSWLIAAIGHFANSADEITGPGEKVSVVSHFPRIRCEIRDQTKRSTRKAILYMPVLGLENERPSARKTMEMENLPSLLTEPSYDEKCSSEYLGNEDGRHFVFGGLVPGP